MFSSLVSQQAEFLRTAITYVIASNPSNANGQRVLVRSRSWKSMSDQTHPAEKIHPTSRVMTLMPSRKLSYTPGYATFAADANCAESNKSKCAVENRSCDERGQDVFDLVTISREEASIYEFSRPLNIRRAS